MNEFIDKGFDVKVEIKLDLHVHTAASFDSRTMLSEAVSYAKACGLSGFALTDHNHVATELPDMDDFLILSGCEYSTDAGHMLVYFLDKDISEGLPLNRKGQYPWRKILTRAHAEHAVVFLAHPYAPYIARSDALYAQLDGIEGYNARSEHTRAAAPNARAQALARQWRKPISAGSDAHFAQEIGSAFWRCELPDAYAIAGRKALLDALREKLLSGDATEIYGGTASPIYRPMSQWVKLKKKKQPKRIVKLIPRFFRSFLQCLKPKRKPKRIPYDICRDDREA